MAVTLGKRTDRTIEVKLDGKIVGKIKKVLGGWAYYPLGAKMGGDTFLTALACLKSL